MEDADTNEDGFLLNEGLDLLASYRSIADRATRLRLKDAIDAVARGEGLHPAPVVVHLPIAGQPRSRWADALRRGKAVAASIALLLGATVVLEIADPAPTDVIAASIACMPAAALSPGGMRIPDEVRFALPQSGLTWYSSSVA